ncbi:glycosylphosphatidylinositol anchor biosynthesis [Dimargaris cristalligena]|uniref:Mannosyltransferase n=1 Tax=Dimargaris cristalligena TaxID=215637 RepID=A0A4P9ZPQ3_9FUNG|nr:glycosylphosphatidylinositol anchor biosynthesis [Dimargaris cristalligena]RKP35414.1 Alg9-like mannosyltransferase family-domain-containing protein [Dimargaris cristalligena]|eukprot:RKP35414.1 Alg9-like mannosyltransferase family-domain-containing protein [Dimargaris cristalligena]
MPAVKRQSKSTAATPRVTAQSPSTTPNSKSASPSSGSGSLGLFLAILTFRLLNAFSVQTFLLPDETWQSLEVAHHMVFGTGYLTWEWAHRLRGYAHPWLFAQLYRVLTYLEERAGGLVGTSEVLIYAPVVGCGLTAAVIDWATYRFTRTWLGPAVARWALWASLVSWTMGTLMVRPLANAAETACVALALTAWPTASSSSGSSGAFPALRDLPRALAWAALGCLLRPTSALLWLGAGLQLIWHHPRWIGSILACTIPIFATALGLMLLIDHSFYGEWVFVPFNFYYFNVDQNLSAWFGTQPWYWYPAVGIPLLLTTLLPHALYGTYLVSTQPALAPFRRWLWIAAGVIAGYSALSHKEARFLSCLLPIMFALTGLGLQRHLALPARKRGRTTTASTFSLRPGALKYFIFLLITNLPVTLYTNLVHQRGVVDVVNSFRHQLHEQRSGLAQSDIAGSTPIEHILFLMPCHSTPYYSHIHYNVSLSFLGCEPPVNFNRPLAEYQYDSGSYGENPALFLHNYFDSPGSIASSPHPTSSPPSHIVIYDVDTSALLPVLHANNYTECGRFFNTHWNGDSRRRGDVVVFCRKPV